MQPARIHATRERILLILVLALGMGFPPPAQAYLLEFTVASINPGFLISYAGSCPPGPPLAESNLTVIDLRYMGETEPNKNDALLAYFGILRQSVDDNINPGFAGSFASAPGAFTGTMVPSGNILNRLAPFYSNLLLLGCGLMGLVGLRYRRRRG